MSTNYINKITDTAGTTHDIQLGVDTRLFRATCSTAAATAAKVATLDDSINFNLTAGVRVLVTFSNGNSATTPTLNINSTGAKNIMYPIGNASLQNTAIAGLYEWGPYDSIIFTYDGTYWIRGASNLNNYIYTRSNPGIHIGSSAPTDLITGKIWFVES